MSTQPSHFVRDTLIVVILSAVSAWLVSTFALKTAVPLSFWIGLIFITLLTFIIHRVLLKANKKDPQIFVAYFMGSLTGKLLLSAGLLLILGLTDPRNLKFTALGYFVVYVLLTIVELRNLLPIIRHQKN